MNVVLWMALETTGLPTGNDFSRVLPTEVSTILTTPAFEPVGGVTDKIALTKAHAQVLKADPEVLEYLKSKKAIHKTGVTLAEAEQSIIEVLDEFDVKPKRAVLAGRGAAHFMRPVLNEHMPTLSDRLSDFTLDTSQIIRWFRYSGSLDRLRRHRVDLSEFGPLLGAMNAATGATIREVVTEGLQYHAEMGEDS